MLCVGSSNTPFGARKQFEKLSLGRYFDSAHVVLSCDVGVSKSSPGCEMFAAVVGSVAVPKQECLLIDDRKAMSRSLRIAGA